MLIASPSDVHAERDRIEQTIHRWNADHGEATSTILLPVRWEANATAETGNRPQAIINKQLVDGSDIIVGVFWTRLGTPTGEAESGTAEEIQRSLTAGKHVSLYFSDLPVAPSLVNDDQMAALRAFKARQEQAGLVQNFSTADELERQVASMLVRVVRERFGVSADQGSVAVPGSPPAVIRLQVVRGASSSYRLEVANVGGGEAQDVRLIPETETGRSWRFLELDEAIDYLPPGSSFDYLVSIAMGMPRRMNIRAVWRNEDGTEGETRQSVSV